MNIDVSGLLSIFSAIDPAHAAIVSVIVLAVQRLVSGKPFSLGVILDEVLALFKKGDPTTPATPAAPPPAPPPAPDTLSLLDLLTRRLRERLAKKVADAGGDDNVAVNFYTRIVNALNAADVKADPK